MPTKDRDWRKHNLSPEFHNFRDFYKNLCQKEDSHNKQANVPYSGGKKK